MVKQQREPVIIGANYMPRNGQGFFHGTRFPWLRPHKILVGVVAILLLAVLIAAIIYDQRIKQPNVPSKAFTVSKEEVIGNSLGEGIIAKLPHVAETNTVLEHYVVSLPNGERHVVRKWAVLEPFASVLQDYGNYFNNNGWTIVSNVRQDKSGVLSAFKDATILRVSVVPGLDESSSIIEVEIVKQ